MFPMMCSQPPCMNIEVRIVAHQGGPSRSTTLTPGAFSASRRSALPSQTIGLADPAGSVPCGAVTTPQFVPGWVSR